MPTYEDLVELAKICARGAWAATDESLATVLLDMAKEYQAEAAKFDDARNHEAGLVIGAMGACRGCGFCLAGSASVLLEMA